MEARKIWVGCKWLGRLENYFEERGNAEKFVTSWMAEIV
jgi:hypothetical protein